MKDKPTGTTHYLLNTANEVHYLKYENGVWYSWGYTTPNSRFRSQWNEQCPNVINYFKNGIYSIDKEKGDE